MSIHRPPTAPAPHAVLRFSTILRPLWALLLCLFVLTRCDSNDTEDFPPISELLDGERVLEHDGLQRTYQLFVPDSYAAGTPAPLLLVFHGQSDNAYNMQRATGLDAEAERLGMIVAYPNDAVGDWAEGCGCSTADRENIDDVGFARALIDELDKTYTLDSERIFAAGFSIGGLFVQRLACEAYDVFAAVATVSATMSVPLSRTCRPEAAVSVMIMHGTNDPIFPWEGTQNGALSVLSARGALDQWRMHNRCTGAPDVSERPINESLSLREERYTACLSNTEVRLTAVEGGQHVWYRGSLNTSAHVLDFFSAQAAHPAAAR